MTDIRKRKGSKGVTYQVRYATKASETGYAYKTFGTPKEARSFVESGTTRHLEAKHGSDIRTVEQGVQKWLSICEKEGRNGREPVTRYTLENYKYRAKIILKYPWAKPLPELSKPDVIAFRSWLLENYSRAVAHKALTSFHSTILELVSRGVLPCDIAAGVAVSSASRYEVPVEIPSEAEIQSLLKAADRLSNSRNLTIAKTWQKYRPMLYLAVDSGMRPQEYLVLAHSALSGQGVEIDRALDGSGDKITVTKTKAGRRFIDLSPGTLDMVQHYASHYSLQNNHDLVFPTENGSWQSVRNWRRRGFNRACEEAGLMVKEKVKGQTIESPKFKPYDLRHFYASMLINRRINLKRIQTLMGHRNIQTTLNVYGHLIQRAEASSEPRASVLSRVVHCNVLSFHCMGCKGPQVRILSSRPFINQWLS
jgi:integrase